MTYLIILFLFGLILGLVGAASNPAPYFAALGLVMAAGATCSILIEHGGSFLSLVLFLIYLGGMLVVFAYSAALAAEPFPESWGEQPVAPNVSIYLVVAASTASCFENTDRIFWATMDELKELTMLQGDTNGVALLYSHGSEMLVLCAGVLLLTLFVVLELTRGLVRGSLRAV
nr:NADH dehydrogenase subunit 6 [Sternoptyx diaphana]